MIQFNDERRQLRVLVFRVVHVSSNLLFCCWFAPELVRVAFCRSWVWSRWSLPVVLRWGFSPPLWLVFVVFVWWWRWQSSPSTAAAAASWGWWRLAVTAATTTTTTWDSRIFGLRWRTRIVFFVIGYRRRWRDVRYWWHVRTEWAQFWPLWKSPAAAALDFGSRGGWWIKQQLLFRMGSQSAAAATAAALSPSVGVV